MYLPQYTSLMRTATVKEEKETDKSNSMRVIRNLEKMNMGKKRKSYNKGIANAKDLTIDLPERHDSTYRKLDFS